jgi:hypothetical protein
MRVILDTYSKREKRKAKFDKLRGYNTVIVIITSIDYLVSALRSTLQTPQSHQRDHHIKRQYHSERLFRASPLFSRRCWFSSTLFQSSKSSFNREYAKGASSFSCGIISRNFTDDDRIDERAPGQVSKVMTTATNGVGVTYHPRNATMHPEELANCDVFSLEAKGQSNNPDLRLHFRMVDL